MDLDEQFGLEHLLFRERTCRVCGRDKELMNDFYLIRKNKRGNPSGYSYECKVCTIERIVRNRKKKRTVEENYPDW
tara:strand:- start:48 stop:275 length:228 start_codon:yes stop_codon:yes gene_type:complete